mgnify:CR=1 FL=1
MQHNKKTILSLMSLVALAAAVAVVVIVRLNKAGPEADAQEPSAASSAKPHATVPLAGRDAQLLAQAAGLLAVSEPAGRPVVACREDALVPYDDGAHVPPQTRRAGARLPGNLHKVLVPRGSHRLGAPFAVSRGEGAMASASVRLPPDGR